MSELTKVDICNLALGYLGAGPISSMDDLSTEGRLANRFYDVTRRFMLTAHPWDFATQQVDLGPPVSDVTYEILDDRFDAAYALPAGWGWVRGIWHGSAKVPRWRIFGNYALVQGVGADDEPVAEITFDMAEEDLPDFFVDALAYELAARLAVPLTEKADLADYVSKQAAMKLAFAKSQSAMMKTPERMPSNRFTRVRR